MAVPQPVRTSSFVIPKKIRKEEKVPTDELFHDLLPDDPLFKSEVCRHFFDNLLNPGLRHYVRLDEARRVSNSKLFEKFLHRQQALRRLSAPHEISYGFLLLDADPVEEEFLCGTGLPAGYSFFGDLGRSDQGAYLSKHPDTVSPAPFFDGIPHRILIFKMLRGRSKPVNFDSFRDSPDPAFQSHVARAFHDSSNGGLTGASPHTRFRYSQIFLYEYEGEGRYAQVLSSIYPMAVVTAIFNPPSPQTVMLLSPDETQALIWTGALTFCESTSMDRVELLSHRRCATKPRGLDSVLDVRELVSWTDCLAYAPICKMLTDAKAGTVVRQLQADLDDNLMVNYFTIACPFSSAFQRIHDAMRNEHLAGVTGLPGGVHVLLIPNSELSSLLSLPRYSSKRPVFHVLFFSYKPFGFGSTIPSLEQALLNSTPNQREVLNGTSADAYSMFAECYERIARSQPPHPAVPSFPSGAIPFPPPNMMGVPPPSVFPQTSGLISLAQPPPPPPEPKSTARRQDRSQPGKLAEKTNDEKEQETSRDLFVQAIKNAGNVGKDAKSSGAVPTTSARPSAITAGIQAGANLRDPRVRKRLDLHPTAQPVNNPPASTSVPTASTSTAIASLPLPKVTVANDIPAPASPESPTGDRPYSPSQALSGSTPSSPAPMEIDDEPYSPSKAGMDLSSSPEASKLHAQEGTTKQAVADASSLLEKIAAIASTDKKEAAGKSGLSFDFFSLPKETTSTSTAKPESRPEQLLPDTSSRGSRDAESSFSSPPARTDVSFSSPIQSPSSSSSLSVAHALPKSIPLERESEEISSAEDALTEDIDLRDILNPKPPMIQSEVVTAPPVVTASSPVLSGIASASTFLMPDLSKPPPTIPHLSAAPRHGPTTGIVAPFLRPVDPRQAPPAMPPRMHGYDPRGFSTFPPRGPPPNTSNFPRDPRSIRRSPQDAAQPSYQQNRGTSSGSDATAHAVVVLEPGLLTHFIVEPEELENLLRSVLVWKEHVSSRRASVKCHRSMEQELMELKRRAPRGSLVEAKCDRFLSLINEYTRKGVVEQMRPHSCDQPGLTPNRVLICGISVKRENPDARVIYIGSPTTLNSETAPNFAYNKIELRNMLETQREFASSGDHGGSWRT